MNDWPALLRLAATRFALPPEAFWRLSVKEWAALTAPPPSNALGRGDLEALMALHPDEGGAAPPPGSSPGATLSPKGRGARCI